MTRAIISAITASFTVFSMILSACGIVPPQAPAAEPYDYSQPVPEGDLMGEEWFDDSAIIGHSLMEGFEGFAGVYSNITYFTSTGLSAAGTLGYSKFDLPDGGTGTLKKGLSQREFSKFYIMLGINEITASDSRFKSNMKGIVDAIRESQPDAPIYIMSITPTTEKKSANSPFNKENVLRLNAVLQELCEEEECYYVDLYTCFADDNGYLPADKSTDGVHVTAPQYKVMADYLKSHTVQEPKD